MRFRSLLFAPGDRSDLIVKLGRSEPDIAVVDLEDGMGTAVPKLDDIAAAIGELKSRSSEQAVMVRVEAATSTSFEEQMEWARSLPIAGIVVPKVEGADQLAAIRHAAEPLAIVAGVETARGVALVESLEGPRVVALYFGAEDFLTDMGGRRTPEGTEVLYARSRVALAARLGGFAAIDQAVLEIDDEHRFAADAGLARDLGYDGKICIHPRQVAWAHEAFAPSAEELRWAARVLAASESADGGVFTVDGRMVDEPLIRRSRSSVER